jgi:hypothetical protein
MQFARANDAAESRGWSGLQDAKVSWYVALVCLTLLFFALYFNRFIGLRSGNGEFTTGVWFLRGQLPYRDYFSATPPLNTLKSALLLKLFGSYLIVNRVAGVLERLVIALVLFRWLLRLFPAPFAFVGSLTTIILSAGDLVDPVASYNHDSIFWAILSGFAASYALDLDAGAALWLLASGSGLFAALCLLTKQTVGVGACVAVPCVVGVLLLRGPKPRTVVQWLLGFGLGAALPIVFFALWLHRLHIWRIFLFMAFLRGPAAKAGHMGDFLHRDILVGEGNWFLVLLALTAIALARRAVLRSERDRETSANDVRSWADSPRKLVLGFGAAIAGAMLLSRLGVGTIHNLSKAAVYFAFIGCGLILIEAAVAVFRRRLTSRERQFALFAGVSFFVAFFLSLSWPTFEAMALPGLGLLVAAALHGSPPARRPYVFVLLAVFVFVQTLEKLDLPFGFGGLNESEVRTATQKSPIPDLRGLYLPPEMNTFVNGTLKTIQVNTTATDTIFTYPEMSIFYALSGRAYPTLSGSHNVDVVSDPFAAEEAARLLQRPPAVVIYMKLTPAELAGEDAVWRFGRPSGQHILIAAVERLTREYRVERVYRVGQDRREITVFVRPKA